MVSTHKYSKGAQNLPLPSSPPHKYVLISSFRTKINWKRLPQCKRILPFADFHQISISKASSPSPSLLLKNFNSSVEIATGQSFGDEFALKTLRPRLLPWSAQNILFFRILCTILTFFSCPGQLTRWPWHLLSEWVTFFSTTGARAFKSKGYPVQSSPSSHQTFC